MSLGHALLLLPVGVVAGFVNVVAGGGSLISVPVLIFTGLSATMANGTSRVGLLAQNLMAILNFRQQGFRDLKLGLLLSVPAVLGALAGAQLAVIVDEALFRRLLSIVMLLVLAGILFKRKRRGAQQTAQQTAQAEELRYPLLQIPLFVLIGGYGGFIQAGVGYLLIFALAIVGGLSLVRANSLKVIVIALYMLPSLAVFMFEAQVAWRPGLVLALSQSVGGWLGSTFSIKGGDRWIKLVLALTVPAMALKLLGVF